MLEAVPAQGSALRPCLPCSAYQGFACLYEVPAHVSPYTNAIACHALNPTGDVFDALACWAP